VNALKIPKHAFDTVYFVATALVLIAAWVFFHGSGKNGFDTFPLPWFFMAMFAPLISTGCLVVMWQRGSSPWLAGIATILLLPQAVVLCVASWGALHYLGVLR
jgi:hypothetical protein